MYKNNIYGTCRACKRLPALEEGCLCLKCSKNDNLTIDGVKALLRRIEQLESLVRSIK